MGNLWYIVCMKLSKRCPACSKWYRVRWPVLMKSRKFCSKHCAASYQMGHTFGVKHPRWRGGRSVASNGYILRRAAGHPDANKNKYILEHRFVMEEYLGRRLAKNEDVHHINGVKNDNRIENLIVLKKSQHTVLHQIKYPSKKCGWCGSNCNRHTSRFCGRICFGKYWSTHKKKISRISGRLNLKCLLCGLIFNGSSCRQKFCSRKCYQSFWISTIRPAINTIRLGPKIK